MKASLVLVGLAAFVAAGLEVGSKVPEFMAKDDQGKEWKSSDHIGKHPVVIYFYPADGTGGCTKQACSFRDDMGALKKEGVEVVGVSGDSPENHRMFKETHKLDFTLLADENGEVAKLFGVPTKPGGEIPRTFGEKKVTLPLGVRASRWTFVIGADGKVAFKNTEVTPDKDSKAVLEVVRKLKAEGKKAS